MKLFKMTGKNRELCREDMLAGEGAADIIWAQDETGEVQFLAMWTKRAKPGKTDVILTYLYGEEASRYYNFWLDLYKKQGMIVEEIGSIG